MKGFVLFCFVSVGRLGLLVYINFNEQIVALVCCCESQAEL